MCPDRACGFRMSEVSGFPAMTMHKSMGLKWYNRDIRPEPLPYDLIIADEMSMCDTELLAAFLAAIPSGTTVLLVGDYDQLQASGRDRCCGIWRNLQFFRFSSEGNHPSESRQHHYQECHCHAQGRAACAGSGFPDSCCTG